MATLFASWLSQLAQQQLLTGVTPDKLAFDLSLKIVRIPFVKWVYYTLKKISESKQSAIKDGWDASGISVSWSTLEDGIEQRDTLYDEANAMEKEKTLFVVKGGRCKDAAVAGLLDQIDESASAASLKQGTKRKRDEMEVLEESISIGAEENVDEPHWTNVIEELDSEDEKCDECSIEEEEETQLPENLASCFIPIHTTRAGRTTIVPSRYK